MLQENYACMAIVQHHEVQEWCYRMMNDHEYFEKWRFKDTINDYNSIIKDG